MILLCFAVHSFIHRDLNSRDINIDIIANHSHKKNSSKNLDYCVLIDSIYNMLLEDENEFLTIAKRSIFILIELSLIISKNINEIQRGTSEVNNIEFLNYILDKFCYLCYERSWFSKKAG
jgi:hypothetical protein